jgi:fluoroquinolone resistance protein
MTKSYTEGQTFDGVDYSEQRLPKGEFENCSFRGCNFSRSDLSGIIFTTCTFDSCDLSLAILATASFRETQFRNCKMLGLRFDQCNSLLLSFSFESCTLNFSSFYKLKLKNLIVKGSTLQEVEFIETDLTNAKFIDCDLTRAVFEKSDLGGADFRTARNFYIDPELNNLKKARFSVHNVSGLLDKYKIEIE